MAGSLDGLRKANRIYYEFILISQILFILSYIFRKLASSVRRSIAEGTEENNEDTQTSTTAMQETRSIITVIAIYQLELLLLVDLLLGEKKMNTCISIWRTYACFSTQYICDFTQFIPLESHLWQIQIS